jgi:hypothetical protein
MYFCFMKSKKLKASKAVSAVVDHSLARFQNQVLSPEKLSKANRMLSHTGFPKK